MTHDFTDGDDWIPPDDGWTYVIEHVTPHVPWWRNRDIVIAGSAGVFLVLVSIVAMMAVTAGASEGTEDRLPVVISWSTTSSSTPEDCRNDHHHNRPAADVRGNDRARNALQRQARQSDQRRCSPTIDDSIDRHHVEHDNLESARHDHHVESRRHHDDDDVGSWPRLPDDRNGNHDNDH